MLANLLQQLSPKQPHIYLCPLQTHCTGSGDFKKEFTSDMQGLNRVKIYLAQILDTWGKLYSNNPTAIDGTSQTGNVCGKYAIEW